MTRQIGPQLQGIVSEYLVAALALKGYYTTIQEAIDQAVADGASAVFPAIVYIKPGIYVEDLTLHPWVHLSASIDGEVESVIIRGNAIFDAAGRVGVANLFFQSINANAAISVQGANVSTVHLDNSKFESLSGIGIECTAPDGIITVSGCRINAGNAGRCLNCTAGQINVYGSNFHNTNTASTCTVAGNIYIQGSRVVDAFVVTDASVVFINNVYLQSGALECFNIDAGAQGIAYASVLESTAVSGFYVTGVGTFVYSTVTTPNNTTPDPLTALLGFPTNLSNISFDGGTTTLNTDGQIWIGSGGGNPAPANITSAGTLTVTNGANTLAIDLTVPVTVASGGTGQTSLTDHNLLVGSGTAAVDFIAPSATSGNPLTSTGAGSDPAFTSSIVLTTGTVASAPVSPSDITNKAYVDALAAGFTFKQACEAATTANLTATYSNGAAGVGATLTNSGTQAVFSIDGQSPTATQRVLIKNQTNQFENGIYEVTNVGSGATNWVLTRTTDYDTAAEIIPGTIVYVKTGATFGNTYWVQYDTVVTVGTDPIEFSLFGVSIGTFLESVNNLSDVANVATSRTNLGLTAIATQSTTQYNVQVGSAGNALTQVPPSATSGVPLVSNGSSANPSFSTVTVPGGGTGITSTTPYGLLFGGTTSTSSLQQIGVGTAGQVLSSQGAGSLPQWISAPTGTVTSVSGTANRITSTGGVTPVIDISASYVGQSSITTLGTITTGTWNGTTIAVANGGTGVTSQAAYAVVCGGTTNTSPFQSVSGLGTAGQVLTSQGPAALPQWANAATGTVTSVSGTVNRITSTGGATPVIDISAAYVGQTSITTLGTVTTGTWNGTAITVANGGTGITSTTPYGLLFGGTTSTANLQQIGVGVSGQILSSQGAGSLPQWINNTVGTVTSVSGTTNRITSTGGTTPVIDISAAYVGQSSITTLGTITTGVWNATAVTVPFGGTGSASFNANGVVISNTTITGALSALTLTSGQVVIGGTSTPAAATLTAGSGISITNGNNSITIASTGTGIAFVEVTGTTQAMSANTAYAANNGSLVVFTLPVTAAAGTTLEVSGLGSGGWKINQNLGQRVQFGSSTTTSGVGGSLASNNPYDSITMRCVIANSIWVVTSSIGNITLL